MKLILVGYPGSKTIRKASKHLIDKYLPEYEQVWLEYDGAIENWASFIAGYLSTLKDEKVIFTLDDYLIAGSNRFSKFPNADLVKLCYASEEENDEYPVTTQYTIWKREYLIELLNQVKTPWEFEIKGSEIHKKLDRKAMFSNAIPYFTNSSLSKRWEGVRLDGLNDEDVKEVQTRL